MSSWVAVNRATICDSGAEKWDVYAVDLDESMTMKGTTSGILMHEYSSGRHHVYVPRLITPPFDPSDMFLICTDSDGEVCCNDRVKKCKDCSKDDVSTTRYTVEG
jgi:hypothetical protein